MNAKPIQLIAVTALTASLASYYTAPASKRVIISKFTLTNTDAGVQNVDVHVVPTGGSADSSNIVIKQLALDAGQTAAVYQLEGHIMAAGDEIHAVADDASVVLLFASGVSAV